MQVFKYEFQKDSVAMLAVKSSAGVAPEVNLRNSLHAGNEVPGFETQDRHHQVQNRGISGSTKRTDVFQLKKKRILKTGCETIPRQHRKEGRSILALVWNRSRSTVDFCSSNLVFVLFQNLLDQLDTMSGSKIQKIPSTYFA